MHRGGTVERRATVPVVYLVNLLVQVGVMEEPVRIVADCLVVHEEGGYRGKEVQPAVIVDIGVQGIFT